MIGWLHHSIKLKEDLRRKLQREEFEFIISVYTVKSILILSERFFPNAIRVRLF